MKRQSGLLLVAFVLLRGAAACSDTPIGTPASDGNYDDEGAPGNMNDPGTGDDGGAAMRDAARDSSTPDAAADTGADAAPDSGADSAADADAESDGAADAADDVAQDAADAAGD